MDVNGRADMPDKEANRRKYENYREQMRRLSSALRSGFYLEAIFIEYAIIEDRLESALAHADAFNPKKQKTINAKLNKLEMLCENRSGLARKYFSPELIESMRSWKDKRNPLIHELMRQKLETRELEEFAREGEVLVKALKSKVGSFNRAIGKNRAKENGCA